MEVVDRLAGVLKARAGGDEVGLLEDQATGSPSAWVHSRRVAYKTAPSPTGLNRCLGRPGAGAILLGSEVARLDGNICVLTYQKNRYLGRFATVVLEALENNPNLSMAPTQTLRPTPDRQSPSNRDADAPGVLIVEDDSPVAELYAEWVTGDYPVRVAQTAAEARTQWDTEVAVVMLDRRLRTTTAADILEDLREAGSNVKIAMITAVEPDVDIIEMEVDEYITKPLKKAEFRACITRLLHRRTLSQKLDYHFKLASKLAAIETSRCYASPNTTAAASRLQAEFEQISQDITAELQGLSPEEYHQLLREVNR